MNLTETQKAWLAAAMDGEGTISFKPRAKHQYVAPRISLGNTNLEFIQHACNITGIGYIHTREMYYAAQKRKFPMFVWEVYGLANSAALLEQILPYLIIKRDIAKQLLLFCKFRLIRGKRKFGKFEQTLVSGKQTEIDELAKLF